MSNAVNNPYKRDVPDKTLTREGVPADAQATGNAIKMILLVPDYAKKELISDLRTAGRQWTAPSNGYLTAGMVKDNDNDLSEYSIKTNGINIVRYKSISTASSYMSTVIPLEKGAVLECEISTNMYFTSDYGPYFVPAKDL